MKHSQFANQEYTAAQVLAIRMLEERPDRDIYEGADVWNSRKGSNEFFVTYGPGPMLTEIEVNDLIRRGVIKNKFPDAPDARMYCLVNKQSAAAGDGNVG